MKLGDFELFEEFDSPFCPIDPKRASRILVRPVKESFEATAASITPGGHPNFPHLWPGQTPSPGSGGTRDDYAV